MVATYPLGDIQRAVQIGTMLSKSWFRGHATPCGELRPKVFRKEYDIHRKWLHPLEYRIIQDFRLGAPVLTSSVPDDEDNIGWMFLMQRHGTPTRLLDWTESPLIALFFAVSENQSEDGELWAMYPDALNKHSGGSGVLLPNDDKVLALAAEPNFSKDSTEKSLYERHVSRFPIALSPPMRFERMIAQLSVFTLHPMPHDGETIPDLLTDEEHLVRYTIPADRKPKLQTDLHALGITRRSLFPDLEGLSRTIIDGLGVLGYSPPKPPH